MILNAFARAIYYKTEQDCIDMCFECNLPDTGIPGALQNRTKHHTIVNQLLQEFER